MKYVKEYLRRGLMFSGFGPIIAGIVLFILSFTIEDFSLSGAEVFLAIISTYLLAFVQAGASVFNQIEHWSIGKSLFFHFASIYLAYSICYVANSWIPFEPMVLLIFTAVFVAAYFAIWLTVYFIARATGKKLTKNLR